MAHTFLGISSTAPARRTIGSSIWLCSAIARQSSGSPYALNAIVASVSPRCHHMRLGVVGGLEFQLGDLVAQRLVLFERHGEHGAQRHTLRAEERESLFDAVDHALETVAPLPAQRRITPMARKCLIAPTEQQHRRSVRPAFDLDELIELVGQLGDRARRCRPCPSPSNRRTDPSASVSLWPRTNWRIGESSPGIGTSANCDPFVSVYSVGLYCTFRALPTGLSVALEASGTALCESSTCASGLP